MQVKKRHEIDNRWAVELNIPDTAIVTLYTNSEGSADAICQALDQHVVSVHAADAPQRWR